MVYIRQIFTRDEFNLVPENYNWVDGIKTTTDTSGITDGEYGTINKKNFESVDSVLDELVMRKLNSDMEFYARTIPDKTTELLLSKTIPGGYYRAHVDMAFLGDYSTTLFLQDPDEYEGGELELLIDGRSERFKLPYGHAITYPSGTTHQVREVTSGVRYVTVFWTSSRIKDPEARINYSMAYRIMNYFPPETNPSFEEFESHPLTISKTLLMRMEREHFR